MNTAREVFEHIANMMNAIDKSGKFSFNLNSSDPGTALRLLRSTGEEEHEAEEFLALEWSEEHGWYVVEEDPEDVI